MQMDYFRRPQLAGKNIKRLTYATIRGALRRSDADVNSPVPYFPGIDSTHNSFHISLDGSPLSVTIPDGSLTSVLLAINTALGVNGSAYELDGTIYIQSGTAGTGTIEVTGGSAAPLLGFDTTTGNRIYSTGGDIASAPEGRVGNPFGATWPGRAENFAMDTLRQALSRLSGNMDVIYSDVLRSDTMLQLVSDYTYSSGCLTVGDHTRLYIGPPGGFLSRSTAPGDLTPVYLLLDSTTKQPMANKVVAVTRGQTTLPVTTDTSSWSGSGNVLGQDVIKGTYVVSSIKNGQVVAVQGSFGTSVLPGDLVEFTGATNTSPFSNNGLRWAVHKVMDTQTLVLRPASKSELDSMGQSFDDSQSLVELNDSLQSGQVYGSITIHSGSFCNGVNLLISPPLTSSSGFELWASVPRSVRDGKIKDFLMHQSPVVRSLTNDLPMLTDGFMVAPVGTVSGGNVQFTSSLVRWKNRLLSLQAATLTPSGNGEFFVYWIEGTNSLAIGPASGEMAVDPNDPTGTFTLSGTPGICVGVVEVSGGVVTYNSAARQLAEGTRTFTVGYGGQFPTLDMALNHLYALVAANGANYPQTEIVLVSDCSMNAQVLVTAPSLTIRGVNPDVTLTLNQGNVPAFNLHGGGTYTFKDFQTISNNCTVFAHNSGGPSTTLFFDGIQDNYQYSSGFLRLGGNLLELNVKNCDFQISSSVSEDAYTTNVWDSFFQFIGSGSAQMFSSQTNISTPWSGAYFSLRNCHFFDWATTTNTPLLINGVNTNVVVDSCTFANDTPVADSTCSLASTGQALFENCISTSTPLGILGTTATTIKECSISTAGPANVAATTCGIAEGSSFQNSAFNGFSIVGSGATILQAKTAQGNTISGVATVAISLPNVDGSIAEGNSVSLTLTSMVSICTAVIANPTAGATSRIVGNQIRVSGAGGSISGSNAAIYVYGSNYSISANDIDITTSSVHGIWINGASIFANIYDYFSVSANRVNINSAAATTSYGILLGTGGYPSGSIDSNVVNIGTSSTSSGICISKLTSSSGWMSLTVTGNFFYGSGFSALSNSLQDLSNCLFSGNYFSGQIGTNLYPLQNIQFLSNRVSGVAYFGDNSAVTGCNLNGAYFLMGGSDAHTAQTGKFSENWNSGFLTAQYKMYHSGNGYVNYLEVIGNHVGGVVDLTAGYSTSWPLYSTVEGNVFSDIFSMANGRFTNNTCLNTFTTSYGADDVVANRFSGNSTIVLNNGGNVSSNYFGGSSVSITNCDRFVGNNVNCSISLSANEATGNYFAANAQFNQGIATGNTFQQGVTVSSVGSHGEPNEVIFSSNYVFGQVSIDGGCIITGNWIYGSIVDVNDDYRDVVNVQIVGNDVEGSVTLNGQELGNAGEMMFNSNFVTGSVSIQFFNYTTFDDNIVLGSTNLYGSWIKADGLQCASLTIGGHTSLILANSLASSLTINNILGGSTAQLSNLVVGGAVALGNTNSQVVTGSYLCVQGCSFQNTLTVKDFDSVNFISVNVPAIAIAQPSFTYCNNVTLNDCTFGVLPNLNMNGGGSDNYISISNTVFVGGSNGASYTWTAVNIWVYGSQFQVAVGFVPYTLMFNGTNKSIIDSCVFTALTFVFVEGSGDCYIDKSQFNCLSFNSSMTTVHITNSAFSGYFVNGSNTVSHGLASNHRIETLILSGNYFTITDNTGSTGNNYANDSCRFWGGIGKLTVTGNVFETTGPNYDFTGTAGSQSHTQLCLGNSTMGVTEGVVSGNVFRAPATNSADHMYHFQVTWSPSKAEACVVVFTGNVMASSGPYEGLSSIYLDGNGSSAHIFQGGTYAYIPANNYGYCYTNDIIE